MKKKLTFFDIIKTDVMETNKNEKTKSKRDLESLEKEWMESRDYALFCKDGILLEEEWDKSRTKILFLLKETFIHFFVIRGRAQGPHGNSKTFWRRMQMWTYLTDKIYNNEDYTFQDALKIKDKENSKIAYVNIKKNVTLMGQKGRTSSDYNDIAKYARQDSHFLRRQIELINPDVIICCGTYDFMKNIFTKEEFKNNKVNSIWVIKAKHLSFVQSYQRGFFELEERLLKIRNIDSNTLPKF